VTDFAGSTNFLVLALVSLALSDVNARQILVAVLVCIWAIRLAAYLLYRIIVIGTDARFDDKREKFCAFLGFWIFQMMWVWCVMLPVTFLESTAAGPKFGTAADVAGLVMFILGLLVETVADQQKFTFKRDPTNRGHWCDVGLWKWSRHPNYAGEIFLWWGLFTICSSVFDDAADAGEGKWGYATILGPMFLTNILLFVSGIPLLEKSADERYGGNQEYVDYKNRTSVLLLVPPAFFSRLPLQIKARLFCEWGMYDHRQGS
jgi:steroid 5-alpha reductase family enzyme